MLKMTLAYVAEGKCRFLGHSGKENQIYQNVSIVPKFYPIFQNKTVIPGKYQAIYKVYLCSKIFILPYF